MHFIFLVHSYEFSISTYLVHSFALVHNSLNPWNHTADVAPAPVLTLSHSHCTASGPQILLNKQLMGRRREWDSFIAKNGTPRDCVMVAVICTKQFSSEL